MDDQVQNPTIPANQTVNNSQDSLQSQQQLAQTPVSYSPHKESEPVVSVSNQEISLHPEVEAAGVKVVSEEHKLDEVHKQLGLTQPGPSTPVAPEPTGAVTLPMSKQEAVSAEKGKDDDSKTWLGTLLAKIYRRLGVLSLREVKS